jgi:hypothetical protein
MRVLRRAGTAANGNLRFTTAAMRLPLVAGGRSTTCYKVCGVKPVNVGAELI